MPARSTTPARTCLAVVLAAGEGTRMKSDRPKVLHEVAGRPMVGHVVAAVAAAGAARAAVVVGPDREDVAQAARAALPAAAVFIQRDRLGTAHAVLSARAALEEPADDVVVAFGDTPLITPETFTALRAPLAEGAAVVVLGFEARDPSGYGRLIQADGQLAAIREHRDATEAERAITLCNAGLMALRGDIALSILDAIDDRNAKGEYYLTDAVEVATRRGERTTVVIASEDEVQGINDRAQLAQAERTLQERLRREAMANGATLLAPETVFFSYDTRLGRDVLVEPHVFFGLKVNVEDGAVIHAFSHLEGARVSRGAQVGPFARLRPGAVLGPKAKVGNFVEIKNVDLGAGAKVSHLTYLGDASVGANANIGAGTITCNYDGYRKYRTTIGEGAFVGSNSALVAPVTIGDGAFVGSGSVITDDVPANALAVARGRQAVKEGWAKAFRAKALAEKK
jgi:bifunctional UDP-N-acetylglucosamine pyrophosphorylase/glucosamine-1-phosphate N-acetyltransferase